MNAYIECTGAGNWFSDYRCRRCGATFTVDAEDEIYFDGAHDCAPGDGAALPCGTATTTGESNA